MVRISSIACSMMLAMGPIGAGDAFTVSSRGDWEGAPTRAELGLLRDHGVGTTLR